MNTARYEGEANVIAYQIQDGIYFRTIKHIEPESELLVLHSKEYRDELLPKSTDKNGMFKYILSGHVGGERDKEEGGLHINN